MTSTLLLPLPDQLHLFEPIQFPQHPEELLSETKRIRQNFRKRSRMCDEDDDLSEKCQKLLHFTSSSSSSSSSSEESVDLSHLLLNHNSNNRKKRNRDQSDNQETTRQSGSMKRTRNNNHNVCNTFPFVEQTPTAPPLSEYEQVLPDFKEIVRIAQFDVQQELDLILQSTHLKSQSINNNNMNNNNSLDRRQIEQILDTMTHKRVQAYCDIADNILATRELTETLQQLRMNYNRLQTDQDATYIA